MQEMDERRLKNFIEEQLRENHELELKKSESDLPRDFWESYSAFSNTSGGYILLGVTESNPQNIITGVKNPDKIIANLFNLLTNRNKVSVQTVFYDDVSVRSIEGKNIVIVRVHEASENCKPVYLNNRIEQAYLRVGSGDHVINQEQLRTMLRNANPIYDAQVAQACCYDDLDPISVTAFKEKVSLRYPGKQYEKMSPVVFLLSIGAIIKDRHSSEEKLLIKKGTLLFLGKYNVIREYFPSFHMDYFNRKHVDVRWLDRVASDEPQAVEMNIYQFYHIVSEKLRLLLQGKILAG